MHRKILSRSSLLACGTILLVGTAAVAVAGSGVGGVFNLGQQNRVNARTQLQGAIATQQLYVVNTSPATGSVSVYGQSNKGTGLWGRSNRMGVRAFAGGASGANYGLYATTSSYEGVAGFFRNTGTTPDLTYGTAVRALGAGATGNEINRRDHAAGAGEFIGYVGVTGASSYADGGAGVLALSGAGDYGIYATSDSPDGQAGFFQNTSGTSNPLKGTAVRGLAAGASEDFSSFFAAGGAFAGPDGVIGVASIAGGVGVVAVQGVGLYALQAFGNAHISGHLSKGSGAFKIDHPLDPANKYLSHSFVESPDMMNIYNGNVVTDAKGEAVVELPDYFEALNRAPRYQLTVIGSFAAAQISRKVSGNSFAIQTSEPRVEVSWQVTGIRRDAFAKAHPIVVEEEKLFAERGRYLHPKEYGKSESLGIAAQAVASREQ